MTQHDSPEHTHGHAMDNDVKNAVADAKKRFCLGDVKTFLHRFASAIKHHPWWTVIVLLGSVGACKLCVYFAGTIIAAGIICASLPKEQEQQ